ncbi:MAG TPA: zinc-dependent metalloprotease [Methylomirabilota bacterium]|nr:zinc-dependent metalloprotease [Methylomirabilota bacterium]
MNRQALRRACIACSLWSLVAVGSASAVEAKPAAAATGFATKTKGFTRRDGLLVTWVDRKAGKLLLELPRPAGPRNECGSFLLLEGIETGLGSNPVGLDRGQAGETRVVTFRRVGARVLLEQPNLRYRAVGADSHEVRAVRESFATSVLWAGEVAAETPEGRLLVDLTSLLVRDAHGVVATLKRTGQGAFSLDKDRSTLDPDACKAFPDNLEFGALLTFASEEPGPEVRETAPTPQAVTLVEHQSLVRLPDAGYRPRAWDPRSGSFEVLYADYAQPVAADIDRRWLVRHRLQKVDPTASHSRARKPIVYYVDSGAPEPIRSALVEGASWWASAFEAAGFVDAFQVKLLPADVDPLDVRYNVIQWVHRATRGWSYGGGVVDPRTGEMLKGHVTLGSLRIRQDRMIFEGLAGAEKTGTGTSDDPVQLALARIRQLAAHEVGHTLGFNHNFAASTYGGRASVMDYPAPLVGVRADSTLDFANAYGTGVGVWDLQQTRYAYAEFASDAEERAGLEAILRENRDKGYLYMSDGDTRPAGAAHPLAAMWDNGDDPVAELTHELAVRRLALRTFGERNIPAGTPMSTLTEVLVPLYFHHRYALEAAAKSVGGLDYAYAVREAPTAGGSGSPLARPVPAARQRAALAAVLGTLDPAQLDLPEPLLALLLPAAVEYPPHREFFGARTAPAFDALGAAGTAAELTLSTLLPSERLARCVDFHRREPSLPGCDEVLSGIVQRAFAGAEPSSPRLREIRRVVQAAVVRRLIAAASLPAQTPAVRAALESTLRQLAADLARGARSGEPADRALRALLAADLERWLARPPAATTPGAAPEIPPGPPIGGLGLADDCDGSPSRE